jgi:hypothetical protein
VSLLLENGADIDAKDCLVNPQLSLYCMVTAAIPMIRTFLLGLTYILPYRMDPYLFILQLRGVTRRSFHCSWIMEQI